MKQVENKSSFNSVSWWTRLIYSRTWSSYVKRHMEFTITEYERDAWLENMHTAIQHANFPAGVGDYLFERLRLTANHMVNSKIIVGEYTWLKN